MTELENCKMQIDRMRALLDDATLDNVRDKYQRSLRAWEARAEIVERTLAGRAGRA
ncbi:hypothetical protein PX699_06525 [Sphingobium sp. H39-3-25]|uniref:hypothetical protein n=1 Tax=Sphingobium arseniciresistens TaxID=3030834 RepID=UPI0023B9BE7D|nr:hypothetical protein [Sphingobium arseniciresistens]